MAQEILQQLELAHGQVEQVLASRRPTCHEIQLQVGSLQPEHLGRSTAAKERANPSQELRQRERLDEVVVGAAVQPEHAIVHTVPGGQNEDWCVDLALPQGLEDLDSAAARKHEIQKDQVEGFGVGAKEPVLPGRRHHDVIVLRLERRFENLRQFPFVFDDQDPHLHRHVIDGRLARP